MEDYAGRILAHRYRLPLPPTDEYELVETRAFDTRSGQEVLVRQVPLPEVVDAELLDGRRAVPAAGQRAAGDLPAVRRAIEAAQAAAAVPDHPRLDQVFDVFAEGGSLWIVSELVPARPLAALIADEPLTAYRAAEVASDVLTALRVLHAHGWTHRNITVRTVLVCDDGRVVLTGLAAGAAEEALCGYDPVPGGDASGGGTGWGTRAAAPPPLPPTHQPPGPVPTSPAPAAPNPAGPPAPGRPGAAGAGFAGQSFAGPGVAAPGIAGPGPVAPGLAGPGTGEPGTAGPGSAGPGGDGYGGGYAPLVAPGYDTGPRYTDHITPGRPGPEDRPELKAAARAGAIAAYRAGARAAAAKVGEQRQSDPIVVPEPRPQGSTLPQGYSYPYGGPETGTAAPWHGATPRRPALEPAEPEPDREQDPEPQRGAPATQATPATQAPQSAQPADATHPTHPTHAIQPPHPPQATLPPQPPQATLPPQPPQAAQSADATHPPQAALPPQPPQAAQSADATHPPQAALSPQPSQAALPPHPPQAALPPQPSGLPAQLALPQGYRQADAPERAAGPVPAAVPPPQRSGPGTAGGWSGPRSGLDAERARQTRMAVVGAVTERWAPEQAGSVTGPWQLAAPVGPATDLWALGALLYRSVQGHAPYPEESVAELVEMVCAEPPAFAEECGALRPVVESLLRQDPTERPDFEELRGWLRSLVRSAPEPDAGFAMLPMPEPDPARLPVVRRRGDLHGRHRNPAAPRKPRALGRTLLLGILLLLAGAVAYAMLFMPRSADPQDPGGSAAPAPTRQSPSQVPTGTPESKPAPQTTTPPPAATPAAPAPAGYTTQQDPEHFEIVVPDGWERRGINEAGQVRYTSGQFTLTVVPGRDKVEGNPDPAAYQKDKEQELTPYRTSTWSTVGDVKTTKVGQQLRATGRYTWIDGTGRNVFARNFVVALGGSYHVVMVTGPEDEQGKVTEVFEKATASYKPGG
ncbi:protein kinase [Streptomyces sp. NPDC059193]|uniref:protein kinase n=1 Tax=Streptomyces sp. NPDC059193 TaxID=3346763 RepID=UPI0036870176